MGYHQPPRIHSLESACIGPGDHMGSVISSNLLLEAPGCTDSPTCLVRAGAADSLRACQGHVARGGGCGTNERWLPQTLHSQRPPAVSRRPASIPHLSTLTRSGPVLRTRHLTQAWSSDPEPQNHGARKVPSLRTPDSPHSWMKATVTLPTPQMEPRSPGACGDTDLGHFHEGNDTSTFTKLLGSVLLVFKRRGNLSNCP